MFLSRAQGRLAAVCAVIAFAFAANVAAAPNDPKKPESATSGSVVIYDGNPPAGMYAYPNTSAMRIDESVKHLGVPSLRIDFSPRNPYGGAAVMFPPSDLSALRRIGTLRMWVKGDNGAEKFMIGLGSRTGEGKTVFTWISLPRKFGLTTAWQQINIPMDDFSDQGDYWDDVEFIPARIDWKAVSEFIIKTEELANRPFVVRLGKVEITQPERPRSF